MQLKRLILTHVRAFEQAELAFQPGVNLIVGVNGVGKSTILDTLRFLLAQCLPKITAARKSKLTFEPSDISVSQNTLSAELRFEAFDTDFRYLVQQSRAKFGSVSESKENIEKDIQNMSRERRIEERRLRESGYSYEAEDIQKLTPSLSSLKTNTRRLKRQPLAVYFSPYRSLANTSKGKPTNAFADSLEHRSLMLTEFSSWWLVQKSLSEESETAKRHLQVLSEATALILDTCTDVRVDKESYVSEDKEGRKRTIENTTLLINKDGITLDVRQLSDGERGMLALVLDLARRLSQANPELDNPLEGEAVVLIDEIGLHLHPRWQRTIVKRLTDTFPNCQFIATTHSPLVIGEVDPNGIILLNRKNGHVNVVQEGLQGFGLDSSWILEHIMDTDSRNPEAQDQIDNIEDALEDGELDLAREYLATYRNTIRGDDDEAIRLEASINNMEALADEMDTEDE
ncbi:AAA family ATPase [Leptolyngbya sp. BC1307]|uniref:AAA family ATPase n=1 Tax=Leptolyngbya sp. BC1307 TaxID=2029589 RepID=UPI000EFC67AA|nr:AAA family ATPase [Leptolyngbya sp. BC1307]